MSVIKEIFVCTVCQNLPDLKHRITTVVNFKNNCRCILGIPAKAIELGGLRL